MLYQVHHCTDVPADAKRLGKPHCIFACKANCALLLMEVFVDVVDHCRQVCCAFEAVHVRAYGVVRGSAPAKRTRERVDTITGIEDCVASQTDDLCVRALDSTRVVEYVRAPAQQSYCTGFKADRAFHMRGGRVRCLQSALACGPRCGRHCCEFQRTIGGRATNDLATPSKQSGLVKRLLATICLARKNAVSCKEARRTDLSLRSFKTYRTVSSDPVATAYCTCEIHIQSR